ncbi:PREDICTED: uncharacterized protein LOC106806107 [Priapulus caudatus]|uniref:Uncharacterized protein LOC106806107 n=1 Tax=Priapulus caudatus TaxID=37621 RepID=A0ABM1DU26_PRICU|nr:PREDICTED: uncharacterized protein LOC106806107 [Priapulus caudatus]
MASEEQEMDETFAENIGISDEDELGVDIDDSQSFNDPLKQRSVTYAMTKVQNWCKIVGLNPNLEDYDKPGLCKLLCHFFSESKSPSKPEKHEAYSYNTLRYIYGGLRRYFACSRYMNITSDPGFIELSKVMQDFARVAKATPYPKEASATTPMTKCDLQKLYQSGILNTVEPKGLINKVWFDISLHFFVKKNPKLAQRNMSPSSFALASESGRRYLYICDMHLISEIESGDAASDSRYRMYERAGDRLCPVHSFLKYMSKRNPNCEAFYQWPEHHAKLCSFEDSEIWYSHRAYGQNNLANKLPTISQEAKLSKLYYNSAIRATRKMLLKKFPGKNVTDALSGILENGKDETGVIKVEPSGMSSSEPAGSSFPTLIEVASTSYGTNSCSSSLDQGSPHDPRNYWNESPAILAGAATCSSSEGSGIVTSPAYEMTAPLRRLQAQAQLQTLLNDQKANLSMVELRPSSRPASRPLPSIEVSSRADSANWVPAASMDEHLKLLRVELATSLPAGWTFSPHPGNGALKMLHISADEHPVIRKVLTVFPDHSFSLHVHKSPLPHDHLLLSLFPPPLERATQVTSLLNAVERLSVCRGAGSADTVQLYEGATSERKSRLPDAVVEYADGVGSDGAPYHCAARSPGCQYLTNTPTCLQCSLVKEKVEEALQRMISDDRMSL